MLAVYAIYIASYYTKAPITQKFNEATTYTRLNIPGLDATKALACILTFVKGVPLGKPHLA